MKLEVINVADGSNSGLWGKPMPKEFSPGLVSVVLPTYNRANFVPAAVHSVWEQTYRPVELLVVDDGSKDNTAEVLQKLVAAWPEDPAFRAVYLRQSNHGASAARNQGLLHSHGEFIQYLDSDDVLVRHKLAGHVQVLQAGRQVDIVWSDWLVVDSGELPARLAAANAQEPGKTSWAETSKIMPWEPWPTLTRRSFIAAIPHWNEKTSRWDDWEYALRIMAAPPRRALLPGIACIQGEHQHGRRHDFDFDPAGVEKGLAAVRAAGAARDRAVETRSELDQLVADRYWELFLETINHGLPVPAGETIQGACRYGRRGSFKAKVTLVKIFLKLAGANATRRLLRGRYAAAQ